MGAGVLPATIHNNKLYFLFGKENKFADTPGWSDFGGGTENTESFLNTAIREAGEEFTGFLGNPSEIKKMLKKYGTYNIDYNNGSRATYRMHIFPMNYTDKLPLYYNNNQKFLQTHLDKNVIEKTKIFEKAEIKWMSADTLLKNKTKFRKYFQDIVTLLSNQEDKIKLFIENALGNSSANLYSPVIYKMGSTKGTRSKTHPGRKNYTTKKGDKVFHRKGKYVRLSRKPYSSRRKTQKH